MQVKQEAVEIKEEPLQAIDPQFCDGGLLPPSTIKFSTGEPVHVPRGWETPKMGKLAAKYDPRMDCVRLAGSLLLKFDVPRGESKPAVLSRLVKQIRSTNQRRHGNSVVTWNKEGEPGNLRMNGRYTTIATVKREVQGGGIIPTHQWMLDAISVLFAYVRPEASPWNAPLMRIIMPIPERNAATSDSSLNLDCHVYFTRLLFYLIADDALHDIMAYLRPVVPVTCPVHSLPKFPSTFVSKQGGKAAATLSYAFTMAGLLKAHEHPGYRKASQPKGISLSLKEYQLQSLAWMQDHEALPAMGLNSLFWEERSWGDGGKFYYFPAAGELRLERPPTVRGGLLCEEMGLGKTVEMAALIAADLCARRKNKTRKEQCKVKPTPKQDGDGLYLSNSTLVIAPLTLVRQWIEELRKCAGNLLTVGEYPIDSSDRIRGKGETFSRALAALSQRADVLVTTYRALSEERKTKVLQKIHWRRVVLDEMQEVRSSTTELARSCANLKADFRWMMSGTPLYTSISDLNGELNFLGVQPFCLNDRTDGFWERRIGRPWTAKNPRARDLLDVLLSGVMIRHSKSQTTLDGVSILELPPFQFAATPIRLDSAPKHPASHTYVYSFLEELAAANLRHAFSNEGIPDSSLQRGLGRSQQLLRLLREVCISSTLINGGIGCKPQIEDLNLLLRERMRWDASAFSKTIETETESEVAMIPAMDGASALNALITQNRFNTPVANERSKFYNSYASFEANMVRHADNVQRNYDAKRQRAMETIQQRLTDVEEKVFQCQSRCLQAQARSWFRVKIVAVRKVKSDNKSGKVPTQKIVLDVQSTDEEPGTEYTKESGTILRGIDTTNVSVCILSQPERALTAEELERLLSAMIVPSSKALASIQHDIKNLAEIRKKNREQIKPLLIKKKKLEKAAKASKKKKRQHSMATLSVTSMAPEATVPADLSEQEMSELKRLQDQINEASEMMREMKKKRSGIQKAVENESKDQLCIVQNQMGPKLICRLKRPLRYVPLLRWQWAVEKLTSGRALMSRMSARHLRKTFLRVRLDVELKEKNHREGNGSRKKLTEAKENYRQLVPTGWKGGSNRFRFLTDSIKEILSEALIAESALLDLMPYMDLMKKILEKKIKREKEAKLAEAGVELPGVDPQFTQTGFQLLNDLVEGKSLCCSICLDEVKDPTFTRCVHLFCARCILRCFKASKFISSDRKRLGENQGPCPVCRQLYTIDSLIRVKVGDKKSLLVDEKGSSSSKLEARGIDNGLNDELTAPRYTPAITQVELQQLVGPSSCMLSRVSRFPAMPALLLTHLKQTTCLPVNSRPSAQPIESPTGSQGLYKDVKEWWSPKVAALVTKIRALRGKKVVVFSQQKQAVLHTAQALKSAGIQCVRIVKGDKAEMQHTAVQTFNADPNCCVLILHAGPAAAGLTLTVAQHVILLEPFTKAGEEAQALNRCHRIGQTGQVSCSVLYYKNTVEERMLWYRSRESQFRGDTDHLSILSGDQQASHMGSKRKNMPTLDKFKCLFGLLGDNPLGDGRMQL